MPPKSVSNTLPTRKPEPLAIYPHLVTDKSKERKLFNTCSDKFAVQRGNEQKAGKKEEGSSTKKSQKG